MRDDDILPRDALAVSSIRDLSSMTFLLLDRKNFIFISIVSHFSFYTDIIAPYK